MHSVSLSLIECSAYNITVNCEIMYITIKASVCNVTPLNCFAVVKINKGVVSPESMIIFEIFISTNNNFMKKIITDARIVIVVQSRRILFIWAIAIYTVSTIASVLYVGGISKNKLCRKFARTNH